MHVAHSNTAMRCVIEQTPWAVHFQASHSTSVLLFASNLKVRTHSLEETNVLSEGSEAAEEAEQEDDDASDAHEDGGIEEDVDGVAHFLVLLHEDEETHRGDSCPQQLQGNSP